MLANGAKLGYKKHGAAESAYTDLPGLKEIPEIGVEAEKVDNTKATSPYRLMRTAQDNKDLLDFQETAVDGTKCSFSAEVSVKRTGGGVNGVVEFELTMLVQSDLTWTDPT